MPRQWPTHFAHYYRFDTGPGRSAVIEKQRTRASQTAQATLKEVVITHALDQRSSREPDFGSENQALLTVAEAMTDPQTMLQTLVEMVVQESCADSAGISILGTGSSEASNIRWHAIAGEYAMHANQVIPLDDSPCGLVMAYQTTMLFDRPQRHFPVLASAEPPPVECLSAPFYCNGVPVGTLWGFTSRAGKHFDREDVRILEGLARFASAGFQLLQARDAASTSQQKLEQRVAERTAELAQANEALREIEQRFRRATGIESVGLITFTTDGDITWANDSFLNMSGYNREDLKAGRIRWDVMTPDEWIPHSHNAIRELTEHGNTTPYEKVYVRKDGSRWWGLFAATRLSESEGVEYIIDITRSKEIDARLAASEELFRAIVSQTNVAIALGDLEGFVTFVNEGMTKMLEYSETELIGRHFLDLTHSDDAEASRQNYSRLVTDSIPFQYEKRYIRKDGSVCWVNNSVSPVHDPSGNVSSVVTLSVDISARVQAEHELRESEQQFRALVNATSDAVYRMGPDWSEMYELHGGGFIPDTNRPTRGWLAEYIHPDDRPRVLAAIQEAIHAKGVFELEHRVRRTDGTLGWTLSRAVPVFDQTGEITGWFGAASDMTARRRAEEALRENERDLKERVATATAELRSLSRELIRIQEAERRHLAHELHDEIGQVLTGLSFSLAIAKRGRPNEHLEHAETITQKLLEQVRALTLELRPSVLDDMGLIPALLELAKRFPARTGVKVDLYHEGVNHRFPSEIETVAYRVVQEALTNVARHSGSDLATVRVFDGDHLTIWISDEGAGFNVDVARAVGTHSGLTGMQERASLVGGSIVFDSAPGEGTTIIVELPPGQRDRQNQGGLT